MNNLAHIQAGLAPFNDKHEIEDMPDAATLKVKKGKIEFRLDKTGNIHALVGKLSFDNAKLVENVEALLKAIEENKPTGVKGKLIKKVVIASTMSPGIQIEY